MSHSRSPDPSAPALIAGPYRPPACRIGDPIDDEIAGRVEVMGWTEAPLSWPRIRRKGPAGPVLTAELARAVRTETAQAVAYWWGVNRDQVRKWRHALGVERMTPGTRQVLRAARAKMDPETAARNFAALQAALARRRAEAAHRNR